MYRKLLPLAVGLCLTACGAAEAPPLEAPKVGIIVGEVFLADPTPHSVGGAIVEVYGTSAHVVTEADKQFVLGSIPIGTHTVTISHPASGFAIRFDVTISQGFQTVYLPSEQTT